MESYCVLNSSKKDNLFFWEKSFCCGSNFNDSKMDNPWNRIFFGDSKDSNLKVLNLVKVPISLGMPCKLEHPSNFKVFKLNKLPISLGKCPKLLQ